MASKREDLERAGFIVGERDLRLNKRFAGHFMVAEAYEDHETPTEDGANGPWCIVGHNLDALVNEAWDIWASENYDQDGNLRCG